MPQVGVDVGVVANNGSYAQKLVPENPVMLNRLTCMTVRCMCYAGVWPEILARFVGICGIINYTARLSRLSVPTYIHINNTAYPLVVCVHVV